MTIRAAAAVAIAITLLTGCTPGQKNPDSEEMYMKASALTKLSAAVESTVRYKNPPPELDERELLALATRHDPILLENFRGYQVKVLSKDRHSVVLVCDASGTRALLEDAGCTGPMDRERWKGKQEPCEFSIDARMVCRRD
ncbi:MAG: hypothetical protein M3Q16_03350 [Pseudomonadota bacterium]|nr:hypothetical protein [Pseudomonadota bacterium]